MFLYLCLFLCIPYLAAEPPYKAKEEFNVRIDMQFRARQAHGEGSNARIPITEVDARKESKLAGGQHAYLVLFVDFVKLNVNEARLKLTNSNDEILYNRRPKLETPIKIELGFVDEIKENVASNTYTMMFFDKAKNPVSRIIVTVDNDGSYKVNGNKLGKF